MSDHETPQGLSPALPTVSAAYELLKQWTDISATDDLEELGPATVYKTSVVLWLMLFQRLNPAASLREAVLHFVETAPPELKTNKRLREGRLSTGSASFSDARHRLTLSTARWFEEQVATSIIESTPPSFGTRRVFLIDGTTMTLPPTPDLQRHYPPASNQHGESVWPVALVALAHELSSGAAVRPELGAMYGPQAVAETRLFPPLLARLPASSIVMADAGYGIFSVAYHAQVQGHDFVLRLTADRFQRVRKQARWMHAAGAVQTYAVAWRPSARDRATNPDLPADTVVFATLHELTIGPEPLYLITSLDAPAEQLGALYRRRTMIEVDIRDWKVVLGAEHLRSRSVAMFHKEFAVALVAYNLTMQIRRQAAALAQCEPRRLSFTGVWMVYRQMLQGLDRLDPADWPRVLERALEYAAKQKLPDRPGRSYPREAYGRRTKSTHFQKRKRRDPPATTNQRD